MSRMEPRQPDRRRIGSCLRRFRKVGNVREYCAFGLCAFRCASRTHTQERESVVMEIAVRHSRLQGGKVARDPKKCPQCGTRALLLQRRYVSPPGWGAPTVTEYYDCDYCDASYQFS